VKHKLASDTFFRKSYFSLEKKRGAFCTFPNLLLINKRNFFPPESEVQQYINITLLRLNLCLLDTTN